MIKSNMRVSDATARILIAREFDLGYVGCELAKEFAELLLAAFIWYSRYKHLFQLRSLSGLLGLWGLFFFRFCLIRRIFFGSLFRLVFFWFFNDFLLFFFFRTG